MSIYLTLTLIVGFGGFFAYYRLFKDKKKLIPRLFEACGYIGTIIWLFILPEWLSNSMKSDSWLALLIITLPIAGIMALVYPARLFLYSMQWLGSIGEAKGPPKQPAFRPHTSAEQKPDDEPH